MAFLSSTPSILQCTCRQVHAHNMIITTFKSGGASGGTLASVFNMLDQPAAALKASSRPYSLNPPGSQQGPDGPDDFRVHYNQALRTWTVPSLFQVCDNRVVRRSNALLRYGEPPTPTRMRRLRLMQQNWRDHVFNHSILRQCRPVSSSAF